MRVSANLRFLEFVAEVRNEVSLIVLVFLTKHVIDFTIERICFHAKNSVSVVMLQNESSDEHLL